MTEKAAKPGGVPIRHKAVGVVGGPRQTPLIVRFRKGLRLPYIEQVEDHLPLKIAELWAKLKTNFPGLTLRPLFSALGPKKLREYINRAAKRDSHYWKGKGDLTRYFVINGPKRKEATIIKTLLSSPEVEAAYVARDCEDPSPPTGSNPWAKGQFHLGPAPLGIDAVFANKQLGGDGYGQSVVDVEQGWVFNHEDLCALGISNPLYGTPIPAEQPHGTAVLGLICAQDNDVGGLGVTPQLASVKAASWSGVPSEIGNAMTTAMHTLGPGDVIVVEIQTEDPKLPVETAPEVLAAIKLATDNGIVVVEAAGNGNHCLDEIPQFNRRNRGQFLDTGAIMIGAGRWNNTTNSWIPWPATNYGNRIDCFAPGEFVVTSWSDTNPTNPATDKYCEDFSGTSSATAIIAGAALSVQGMASAKIGSPYPPDKLRAILSDPTLGTPILDQKTGKAVPGVIGVMPDLWKIWNRFFSE